MATQRYASLDLDALANQYAGRVVNPKDITITREAADPVWQPVARQQVTIELDNADGALTSIYTANPTGGNAIAVKRYDWLAATTATKFMGAVTQPRLAGRTLQLECAVIDRAVFQQQIPDVVIDTATWPNAIDAGATIPVVFGTVARVPILYANDDTGGSIFDYLVGHGTLAVTGLYRNGPNDTLYSIDFFECTRPAGGAATSWSEVARTDYSGYTNIRLIERQTDSNNAFYRLYADVSESASGRNFATAAGLLLSNTAWGLGQTTDATSLTNAAAALPAGLYCDGAMTEPRKASEWLAALLMVRGMRPVANATGQIGLQVDTCANTIAASISDDLGDGPRNRVSSGERAHPNPEDRVKKLVVSYLWDHVHGRYVQKNKRVINAVGHNRQIDGLFIRDHTTADMVCDYLTKKHRYGQETIEVTVTQEGRALEVGDLVSFTKASQGFAAELMEVQRITERLTTLTLTLARRSWATYVYEPGTLPADATAGTASDYTRIDPGVPTDFACSAASTTVSGDGHVTALETFTFTLPTTNITDARLEWRFAGGTNWTLGTLLAPTVSAGQIDGLPPGVVLDFAIRSVNSITGRRSNRVTLLSQTTATDSGVPSAPTGVTIAMHPKGNTIVYTSANPADWAHSILYRATSNSSGAATEVARAKSRVLIDFTSTYLTQYWYFVRVEDTSGNLSAFSASVTTGAGGTVKVATVDVGAEQITGTEIATGADGVGTDNIVDSAVTTTKRDDVATYSDSSRTFVNSGDVYTYALNHGLGRVPLVSILISGLNGTQYLNFSMNIPRITSVVIEVDVTYTGPTTSLNPTVTFVYF